MTLLVPICCLASLINLNFWSLGDQFFLILQILNIKLLNKAIGKKLYCIFVNTGLLRKNEEVQVVQTFKKRLKINLIYVNAEKEFLKKLRNVSDPEKKRKIIGNLFIKIFERYAKKIKNVRFLAQGTLYPDLIESKSVTGSKTSKIKSHHNVGGLPKKMNLKLVEPLKFLFKDEVRKLGLELNLSKEIISLFKFNSSPNFLTSSLNKNLSGSTNFKFIFFGRPPTLWCDLILEVLLPVTDLLSIKSG